MLVTAHSAKGREFDHVIILDDDWRSTGHGEDSDAWRRLYYVAMTRARKTLTLARKAPQNQSGSLGGLEVRDESTGTASIPELRGNPSVLQRPFVAYRQVPPELNLRRETLTLGDVQLSFPGWRRANHPMHDAIRRLEPGDELSINTDSTPWEITNGHGQPIGRLARHYRTQGRFHSARVHAVVHWRREYDEPEYQDRLRCDEWEVVLPEFVFT